MTGSSSAEIMASPQSALPQHMQTKAQTPSSGLQSNSRNQNRLRSHRPSTDMDVAKRSASLDGAANAVQHADYSARAKESTHSQAQRQAKADDAEAVIRRDSSQDIMLASLHEGADFHRSTKELSGNARTMQDDERRRKQKQLQQTQLQQQQQQRNRLQRRALDEVKRSGNGSCRFITSLETLSLSTPDAIPTSHSVQAFDGTVFTIQSPTDVRLMGFELSIASTSVGTAPSISMFIRLGEYDQAIVADSEGWIQLIDDQELVPAPVESDTYSMPVFIAPTQNFKSFGMQRNRVYSVYLVLSSDETTSLQLVAPRSPLSTPTGPTILRQDDYLQVNTGLGIFDIVDKTTPFSNAVASQLPLSSATSMIGRFHYVTTQPCNGLRTRSNIYWEFAIDEQKSDKTRQEILGAMQTSVSNAMGAVIVLNADLIRYTKFHGLEKQGEVRTQLLIPGTDAGADEYECPLTMPQCSIGIATVPYDHAISLLPGELTQTFLQQADTIASSVTATMSSSFADTEYIGHPLATGKFVVSLVGVPSTDQLLNSLQRRYVEQITAEFFQQYHNPSDSFSTNLQQRPVVLMASITDAVASDDTNSASSNRYLRGTQQRLLQDAASSSGELQLGVDITGLVDSTDIRGLVLQTMESNPDVLLHKYSTQWYRPGEINELNSGEFFGQLQSVSVGLQPAGFGQPPATSPPGTSNGGDSGMDVQDKWKIVAIVGLVVGLLWLLVQLWRDYIGDFLRAHRILKPKELEDSATTGLISSSDEEPDSQKQRRIFGMSLPSIPSAHAGGASDDCKSLDGLGKNSSRAPKLGSSKSDHVASKLQRPKSLGNLEHFLSDHTCPSPGQRDGGSVDGNKPQNRAGQNGRGVRPTRSMDDSNLVLRNRPGRGNSRSRSLEPQRMNGLRRTKSFDPTDSTSPPSRNRAGQNGRGVRSTQSMDVISKRSARSAASHRSRSRSPNPQRRVIQSTRSLPMPSLSNSSRGRNKKKRSSQHSSGSTSSIESDDSDLDSDDDSSSNDSDDGSEFAYNSNHAKKAMSTSALVRNSTHSKASIGKRSAHRPQKPNSSNTDKAGSDRVLASGRFKLEDFEEEGSQSDSDCSNELADDAQCNRSVSSGARRAKKGTKLKKKRQADARSAVHTKDSGSDVSGNKRFKPKPMKTSKHSPVRNSSTDSTEAIPRKTKSLDDIRSPTSQPPKTKPAKPNQPADDKPMFKTPGNKKKKIGKAGTKKKKKIRAKATGAGTDDGSKQSKSTSNTRGSASVGKVKRKKVLGDGKQQPKKSPPPPKKKTSKESVTSTTSATSSSHASNQPGVGRGRGRGPNNTVPRRVPSKASQMQKVSGKEDEDKQIPPNPSSNRSDPKSHTRTHGPNASRSRSRSRSRGRGRSSSRSIGSHGKVGRSATSFGAVDSNNFDPEFMPKEEMDKYLASPKFEKELLQVVPMNANEGGDVLKTMRDKKYLDRLAASNGTHRLRGGAPLAPKRKPSDEFAPPIAGPRRKAPGRSKSSDFVERRKPPGRSKSSDFVERRKPPPKTKSMDYGKHGKIKFSRRFSSGGSSLGGDNNHNPGSNNGGNSDGHNDDDASQESSIYQKPPSLRKGERRKVGLPLPSTGRGAVGISGNNSNGNRLHSHLDKGGKAMSDVRKMRLGIQTN